MQKKIKVISNTNIGPAENKSDFEKTGITSFKMKVDFTITQKDMEKDLVKRTEGTFIKPNLDENNN